MARGMKGGNPKNLSKPGKTNNPGGAPSYPPEFKAACRMKCAEHMHIVVDILQNGKTESVRLRAWELLANRGFGMPKQEIDVTSDGEKVLTPVVYAQPPSQTPEEWEARHAPKPVDPEKLN